MAAWNQPGTCRENRGTGKDRETGAGPRCRAAACSHVCMHKTHVRLLVFAHCLAVVSRLRRAFRLLTPLSSVLAPPRPPSPFLLLHHVPPLLPVSPKKTDERSHDNVLKAVGLGDSPGHNGSRVPVLSERELREHFNMPLNEVAKKYGMCTTALKKLCRKYGVMQWPHRKLRSLEKKIASLRAEQVQPPSDLSLQNAPPLRTRVY